MNRFTIATDIYKEIAPHCRRDKRASIVAIAKLITALRYDGDLVKLDFDNPLTKELSKHFYIEELTKTQLKILTDTSRYLFK